MSQARMPGSMPGTAVPFPVLRDLPGGVDRDPQDRAVPAHELVARRVPSRDPEGDVVQPDHFRVGLQSYAELLRRVRRSRSTAGTRSSGRRPRPPPESDRTARRRRRSRECDTCPPGGRGRSSPRPSERLVGQRVSGTEASAARKTVEVRRPPGAKTRIVKSGRRVEEREEPPSVGTPAAVPADSLIAGAVGSRACNACRPRVTSHRGSRSSICRSRNGRQRDTEAGGNRFSGGRHFSRLTTAHSSGRSPRDDAAASRRRPARPTNGFPEVSSSAPGASPTNRTRGRRPPRNRTTCSRVPVKGAGGACLRQPLERAPGGRADRKGRRRNWHDRSMGMEA